MDGRTDIATPDGAKNHQHLTWAETVSRKKIAARQITRQILMPYISLKRWSATGWSGDSALYLWCSSLIYFSLMQLKLSSHWFITTQTVFPFAIGHMQVVCYATFDNETLESVQSLNCFWISQTWKQAYSKDFLWTFVGEKKWTLLVIIKLIDIIEIFNITLNK